MTKDLSVMDELRSKQQELMTAVPHPLREDSMERMTVAKGLFENVLLYLNSTGHKPWRPNPLPKQVQEERLEEVQEATESLVGAHLLNETPSTNMLNTEESRMLVSSFGGIEEIIEFYNSYEDMKADLRVGEKERQRAHMLEELTDELFYFLERMVLTDFSWIEVVKEYHRKWQVNMKRYADAKKGDYSWDDRDKKGGL